MAIGSIALSFLIVLSLKIYLSLWCKHTAIQPTAQRELEETKRKKKVTFCVLAVIMTFITFYIPFLIVYNLRKFQVFESRKFALLLHYITVVGLLINAALDPYLFSFQSSRFRVLLKKMVLCKNSAE